MYLSREAASGINRVSYFVAVNVAQIPIILITPIVYLSLLYPLVSPRGEFKSGRKKSGTYKRPGSNTCRPSYCYCARG